MVAWLRLLARALIWLVLLVAWVEWLHPPIVEFLNREEPGLVFVVVTAILVWRLLRTIVHPILEQIMDWEYKNSDPGRAANLAELAPDELRAVARHEAAHAVVHLAGGGSVRWAHIVRADGMEGAVGWSSDSGGMEHEDWLWMRLVGTLAGNVLDLCEGRQGCGSTTDMMDAWLTASAITSTGRRPNAYPTGALEPGALTHAARCEAARLIDVHADWVDRVTEDLLKHKHLDEDAILALKPKPASTNAG